MIRGAEMFKTSVNTIDPSVLSTINCISPCIFFLNRRSTIL